VESKDVVLVWQEGELLLAELERVVGAPVEVENGYFGSKATDAFQMAWRLGKVRD
jgi:hypothetical protein